MVYIVKVEEMVDSTKLEKFAHFLNTPNPVLPACPGGPVPHHLRRHADRRVAPEGARLAGPVALHQRHQREERRLRGLRLL